MTIAIAIGFQLIFIALLIQKIKTRSVYKLLSVQRKTVWMSIYLGVSLLLRSCDLPGMNVTNSHLRLAPSLLNLAPCRGCPFHPFQIALVGIVSVALFIRFSPIHYPR